MDISTVRVGVVCGGPSAEAEVSRSSGREVAAALQGRCEHVAVVEYGSDLHDRLQAEAINVVFPVMHGPPGEDGTLQGFLETIGMPYVGSGVRASATAMDKSLAKLVFRANGLPVADDRVLWGADDALGSARRLDEELGLPVVVKPTDQGSAVEVRFCHDVEELASELAARLGAGQALLVETYIRGREITVGVLETAEDARALPVLEVRTPDDSWYDYEHRYTAGLSQHVVPAALDPEVTLHLQALALEAHRSLGCRDLSRTDLVLADDGSPVLLETNTLPGLTATSLYPDEARAAGIGFPELIVGLVERAHARRRL